MIYEIIEIQHIINNVMRDVDSIIDEIEIDARTDTEFLCKAEFFHVGCIRLNKLEIAEVYKNRPSFLFDKTKDLAAVKLRERGFEVSDSELNLRVNISAIMLGKHVQGGNNG